MKLEPQRECFLRTPGRAHVYGALRGALFGMDPERAHRLALAALAPAQANRLARKAVQAPPPSPRLAVRAFGLDFPTPLGMAAGFDKECGVYNALLAMGFGHVEVGTVTPRAQTGNEPPRMQRLPALQAIVNRLGFPGPGVEACVRHLARCPPIGVVGANVGPNKSTQPERVGEDLVACARQLAPHVAFLTVNVSSPNTPGLRTLQTPDAVSRLVREVAAAAQSAGASRPVLVKLHPDAGDDDLVRVARAAVDAGAAGIVATNTTRARPPGSEGAIEGGLSGAPLRGRARQAIAALHKAVGASVPIVGVGGVFTGADALGHIMAGATLVQAYTGFVYRGPRMATHVGRELLAELDRLGLDRVDEAVGLSGRAAALLT
ncbi:MAG: quinone-dependent dihydroorotate dehydrogenase [Thermoplasmatota archaeon]